EVGAGNVGQLHDLPERPADGCVLIAVVERHPSANQAVELLERANLGDLAASLRRRLRPRSVGVAVEHEVRRRPARLLAHAGKVVAGLVVDLLRFRGERVVRGFDLAVLALEPGSLDRLGRLLKLALRRAALADRRVAHHLAAALPRARAARVVPGIVLAVPAPAPGSLAGVGRLLQRGLRRAGLAERRVAQHLDEARALLRTEREPRAAEALRRVSLRLRRD